MHFRSVIKAVVILLTSIVLMPIDIYRGLIIRVTYDDVSGYPTKQAFYNAFGDSIGAAPTSSWIGFDFNDQVYTADAIRFNPSENVTVGYQYGKHGDVMWDKGLISFTDKLFMGDLNLQIDFVPNNAILTRPLLYSPYVLKNNLLDGIFLKIGNKKAIDFDIAWSHLRPTLRETHPGVYPDTFQGYFGEEAEYLFAGMADLNFLKEIKSELLTVNSLRLSWSAMAHRDSLSRAPAFLGSAPLSDGAVLTTNYSVTNVQYTIAPFRSLDGSNFAAFYGYTVEFEGTNFSFNLPASSIAPPSGTYLTNDSRGTPYLRIDEGSKYTFTIQIPRIPAKKVKITFGLANSFYVQQYFFSAQQYDSYRQQQLHTPADVVVASAKHNIRDFSNYRQYSFYMGITTANHNFGLEADMVLAGFSVKGGIFPNISLLQAPILDADYSPTLSLAWYAEVSRKINDFVIQLALFNCDAAYRTEFAPYTRTNIVRVAPNDMYYQVHDNDNNDDLSAYRMNVNYILDYYESPSNVYDKNLNKYPDYQEDFLRFQAFPDFFYPGDDYNNNGLVDNREDDALPDYRYRENLAGAQMNLSFMLLPKTLEFSTYAAYEFIPSDADAYNALVSPNIAFTFESKNIISLYSKLALKRVQDYIINDVSYQTFPNSAGLAADQVRYRDSSVLDFYFNAMFYPFKDMTVTAIGHMEYNIQHYELNRIALRTGELLHLYYKVPVSGLFKDNAFLKLIFSNLKLDVGAFAQFTSLAFTPDDFYLSSGTSTFAAMAKAGLSLSKTTTFIAGYQFLYYIDSYQAGDTYQKHTAAFEIDNTTKIFTIMFGYAFDYYIYTSPASFIYNGLRDQVFIRVIAKA